MNCQGSNLGKGRQKSCLALPTVLSLQSYLTLVEVNYPKVKLVSFSVIGLKVKVLPVNWGKEQLLSKRGHPMPVSRL